MKLIKSRKPRNLMNIYRLYLKSFPKNERKPFPFILLKQWRGTTEVLSIKNSKGEFLGLAITALQNNLALIAYFAVSSEKRGTGIGSKALQLIRERYSDKKIFLEIENTETESENNQERKKRKNFYLKNGMLEMPFIINFFGTEMEVLTYNSPVTFEEYHSIYKKEFGKIISRKVSFVKNKNLGENSNA